MSRDEDLIQPPNVCKCIFMEKCQQANDSKPNNRPPQPDQDINTPEKRSLIGAGAFKATRGLEGIS